MTAVKIVISLILALLCSGVVSGAFSYFAYGGIQGSFFSTGLMALLYGAGILAPIFVIFKLWSIK